MMRAIRDFYVAENAVVVGDVVLGPEGNIWPGCVLRGDVARLTLGRRVNLQDGCIVHADTDAPQVIEEEVVVGHLVMLHGVRVGRRSLIGIGSRLLGGSVVGEECIIAAGSIVPEGKVIPPRSVVMGIPGKVVRAVTDEEVARTAWINAHYAELARAYVAGQFPPPWPPPG
ncbi:MAG TPA: gamma carbonic anhydrase family protein [Gemmatales bacterium]|nr:gamma carbonic anhydrase family protein [Gemmatales bacterium]